MARTKTAARKGTGRRRPAAGDERTPLETTMTALTELLGEQGWKLVSNKATAKEFIVDTVKPSTSADADGPHKWVLKRRHRSLGSAEWKATLPMAVRVISNEVVDMFFIEDKIQPTEAHAVLSQFHQDVFESDQAPVVYKNYYKEITCYYQCRMMLHANETYVTNLLWTPQGLPSTDWTANVFLVGSSHGQVFLPFFAHSCVSRKAQTASKSALVEYARDYFRLGQESSLICDFLGVAGSLEHRIFILCIREAQDYVRWWATTGRSFSLQMGLGFEFPSWLGPEGFMIALCKNYLDSYFENNKKAGRDGLTASEDPSLLGPVEQRDGFYPPQTFLFKNRKWYPEAVPVWEESRTGWRFGKMKPEGVTLSWSPPRNLLPQPIPLCDEKSVCGVLIATAQVLLELYAYFCGLVCSEAAYLCRSFVTERSNRLLSGYGPWVPVFGAAYTRFAARDCLLALECLKVQIPREFYVVIGTPAFLSVLSLEVVLGATQSLSGLLNVDAMRGAKADFMKFVADRQTIFGPVGNVKFGSAQEHIAMYAWLCDTHYGRIPESFVQLAVNPSFSFDLKVGSLAHFNEDECGDIDQFVIKLPNVGSRIGLHFPSSQWSPAKRSEPYDPKEDYSGLLFSVSHVAPFEDPVEKNGSSYENWPDLAANLVPLFAAEVVKNVDLDAVFRAMDSSVDFTAPLRGLTKAYVHQVMAQYYDLLPMDFKATPVNCVTLLLNYLFQEVMRTWARDRAKATWSADELHLRRPLLWIWFREAVWPATQISTLKFDDVDMKDCVYLTSMEMLETACHLLNTEPPYSCWPPPLRVLNLGRDRHELWMTPPTADSSSVVAAPRTWPKGAPLFLMDLARFLQPPSVGIIFGQQSLYSAPSSTASEEKAIEAKNSKDEAFNFETTSSNASALRSTVSSQMQTSKQKKPAVRSETPIHVVSSPSSPDMGDSDENIASGQTEPARPPGRVSNEPVSSTGASTSSSTSSSSSSGSSASSSNSSSSSVGANSSSSSSSSSSSVISGVSPVYREERIPGRDIPDAKVQELVDSFDRFQPPAPGQRQLEGKASSRKICIHAAGTDDACRNLASRSTGDWVCLVHTSDKEKAASSQPSQASSQRTVVRRNVSKRRRRDDDRGSHYHGGARYSRRDDYSSQSRSGYNYSSQGRSGYNNSSRNRRRNYRRSDEDY